MSFILMFMLALVNPCPTEDSLGCTWNASVQGNHTGRSFVVTLDGQRYFADPSFARAPVSGLLP